MHEYRIGRLHDRFVVTWREEDGRRRRYRLEARTLEAAEAEARDIILAQTARASELTVEAIWKAYSETVIGRPVHESMEYTGRSVLPWFGAFRPDQIAVQDCKAYIADRRRAGVKDGTIWTQLGKLRTCLNWAEKTGLIERAPYVERPNKPDPKERYLSRQEIQRLLETECAPHIKLAIRLLLSTAARVTAVLELTWDRVDFERRQINLRTGEGQRKGRAIVPMTDSLRLALVEAKKAALSDHVVEWAGGPVNTIKKGFRTAALEAGLPDVSPHVLRHTAAVHMAEAGIPMDEIAQYLGHSDSRITASTYARYSPEHLRKAARALEFD
ncbi:site-specific integrase [Salipiger bermudensis]|uniref:tyrosine-type recombinase/integrase n=1 Tax=Salipiger bermudensis TaxID=344736 RepID=UPI001C98F212|nr:site-specific integrase [Salipiger bermudensis]MBY6003277.1 site-specific integrase [Salipiger bermudensis]